ncbi:hypothetical protein B0H34DRAFT_183031 [Crassisporium funariophilum]|nr:hypothetical protein B0H34DRAFT_183031 [Crassisporium funariophilum]
MASSVFEHRDSPTALGYNVSTTVDGYFYGVFFATILFGMLVVLGWRYCHNNNDGWTLRLLVFVSLILATASTGCKLATEHYFLVDNFGEIEILTKPHVYSLRLISVQYLISGVIFWMVHIFFASRLFLLLESWWIPSLLAILSTSMLG